MTRRRQPVDLFLHLSDDRRFRGDFLIIVRRIRRQFFFEERKQRLSVEQRGHLGRMFDLAEENVRLRRNRRIGTGVRADEVENDQILQRFVDQGELIDEILTTENLFRLETVARRVEK